MTVDVVIQSIIDENFIERRPIFSEDGKTIYVIDRANVKELSVNTSECCCNFYQDAEGLEQERTLRNIVGIALHENYLYACTSNCTFLRWSRKGDLILKAKRGLVSSNRHVFDMKIIDYDHESGHVSQPELFAFIRDSEKTDMVYIHTYSLTFQLINKFSYRGQPDPKMVDLGSVDDKHFIVTARGRNVFVHSLGADATVLRFKNTVCDWVVVKTLPLSDTVAAGDMNGKVHLYQHFYEDRKLEKKKKEKKNFVASSIYHWHFHPVIDIAFSPTGAYMYTGSRENVLVRWNVHNPKVRDFLPRLQSTIQHITVCPLNTTIAVSLMDNGIALVTSQMKLHSIIQKFTWYLRPAEGQQIMPAKMSYDPNSRCAIMNGRHGHLQFVSLDRNELIYSMDVCECNYVQEPGTIVYQMEVVRVAVSQDGGWMATVEMRDDHYTAKEVVMKMWHFDEQQKRFAMNTSINLPHYDYEVTAMRFQPTKSLTGDKRAQSMLVTSGADRKFRVWTSGKMLIGSKGECAITWTNDRVGFYRDKEGGPVAFSYDGSVLAVGFGSSLTVWNSDSVEMSSSLTRGSEVIRFIEFEQKPYSHVIVTASSSSLQVWDLLSRSVVWCVKTNVTVLTADPMSDHFAAFTADNQLFVFTATSVQPVHKMADVGRGKQLVMAAMFVPRTEEEGPDTELARPGLPNWLLKSKLYYVTESQEFLAIDVSNSSDWQSLPTVTMDDSSQVMRGAFAQLAAKKVREEAADTDSGQADINRTMGNLVEDSARKLLNLPIHAVPHISLLCEDFLACQLSTKHEFPGSLQLIEKMEEKMKQKMEEKMEKMKQKMEEKMEEKKQKRKQKKRKNKSIEKVKIVEDISLENLFSIDKQSNQTSMDLDMECD